MYCLSQFCCLCLQKDDELGFLQEIKYNDMTFLDIANTVIPEIQLRMSRALSICNDCVKRVTDMYDFRQSSIRNNFLLVEYIELLRSTGGEIGNATIQITDVMKTTGVATKLKENPPKVSFITVKDREDAVVKIETEESLRDDSFRDRNCVYITCDSTNLYYNETSIKTEVPDTYEEFDEKREEFKLDVNEDSSGGCFKKEGSVDKSLEELRDEEIESPGSLGDGDISENPSPALKTEEEPTQATERKYKCQFCGKQFIHKGNLTKHENIHRGIKPFTCNTCGKSFPFLWKLKTHESIHSGEKPYKCETCGKSFRVYSFLYKHNLSAHAGIMLHKCKFCEKEFYHKISLEKHYGTEPHACTICEESFLCFNYLQEHNATQHRQQPHVCKTCGKSYSFLRGLKRHIMKHNGDKLHKCETCGKFYSSLSALKEHEPLHTGEKSHKCDVCGKAFAHRATWSRHYLIHKGEKLHKCDTCGRSFLLKATLKRHIMTHREKIQYECETCGKTFRFASTLKRHVIIHTEDKPYKCETCGKSYTASSSLKVHLLDHTGEKPYTCDICGKSYKMKKVLNAHRQRVHQIVLQQERERLSTPVIYGYFITPASTSS